MPYYSKHRHSLRVAEGEAAFLGASGCFTGGQWQSPLEHSALLFFLESSGSTSVAVWNEHV